MKIGTKTIEIISIKLVVSIRFDRLLICDEANVENIKKYKK